MTNINLTDPEEKIAEDLRKECSEEGVHLSVIIDEEEPEEEYEKAEYYWSVKRAIKCVEFALVFAKQYNGDSDMKFGKKRLEKVLEILKSKL